MGFADGHTWETDPDPNQMATPGRTTRRWVRAREAPRPRAIFKTAPPNPEREMYSIGMEVVAYKFGAQLGLPIREAQLASLDGEDGVLVKRVDNMRDWRMADGAPMLKTHINNLDCFPLGVAFDIWMANLDRKDQHILVEALPPGVRPAIAQDAQIFLIDHGVTGLWFPSKFGDGLTMADTERVDVGDGSLLEAHERAGRQRMPAAYRNAFTCLSDTERGPILDAIRAITDDSIDAVLGGVPAAYMTPGEIEKTSALLKARRDRIDTLSEGYW